MPTSVLALGVQRRSSDPLDLGCLAVMSYPPWVLETELRFFAKRSPALLHPLNLQASLRSQTQEAFAHVHSSAWSTCSLCIFLLSRKIPAGTLPLLDILPWAPVPARCLTSRGSSPSASPYSVVLSTSLCPQPFRNSFLLPTEIMLDKYLLIRKEFKYALSNVHMTDLLCPLVSCVLKQ